MAAHSWSIHLCGMKSRTLLLSLGLVFVLACKKNIRKEVTDIQEHTPFVDFNWVGEQSSPSELTFTNNTSFAQTYKWDFGNGQTSTDFSPGKVVYGQAGTYDVILTAWNGSKKSFTKKTVVITPNSDPVALFSYVFKDQRSYAPASLIFTNESVNAISYEWDINGVFSSQTNPQHITFNQAGEYSIKLIAVKGNKRSAVYEERVVVGANQDPVASFALNYHPFPYAVNEEIQLVNRSTNSETYLWTFGPNGPAPSAEEHPVVKFANAGRHPITLVAKKGGKTSAPRQITILINP